MASISVARRRDAGQMRGRRQRGLRQDALDGRVGALARRAAGAIGDRDEVRRQRRQPLDRLPQRSSPSPRPSAGRTRTRRRCGACRGMKRLARMSDVHHATSRVAGDRHQRAGVARQPQRHRDLAVGAGLGRQSSCASPARGPAAVIHCVTVSGAKPSRRWACCSRRNSSSCGAKSTTSRRPPGAARAPPRGWRARRRRGSAAPDA